MLTGVDRPLGELEDGVLQGRTEGERQELLEATRGKVGEVSSSPDSLSVRTSRRLQFSARDRDLSREMPSWNNWSCSRSCLSNKVQNERKI